ncbi:sulfurtransferase complex subunit TusD [Moraxella sp. DOX410]|nr:sulfurtransferase complex subunit TusD [Moraxella sp. DOX410]WNP26769.1 sulfurtransferase complex subunit TusD [Moraxella sp. DOX410]
MTDLITTSNNTAMPNTSTLDTPIVMLMTHAPSHPLTKRAIEYAQSLCANDSKTTDEQNSLTSTDFKIFLYSDAVMLANRLIWLPDDIENMAKNWQRFAMSHDLTIQVCVSAALARGVTDADNATRHQLQGDNLADGFELVGLGELAMHLHRAKTVYQF